MRASYIFTILTVLLSLHIKCQADPKKSILLSPEQWEALQESIIDPCDMPTSDQPDRFNGYGSWFIMPFGPDKYLWDACVQSKNDKIYYWTLHNLVRPNEFGWLSVKELTELDCTAPRKRRYLSIAAYSQHYAAGRIITDSNSKSEWYYLSNKTLVHNFMAEKYCPG